MPEFPPEMVAAVDYVRTNYPEVAGFLEIPGIAEVLLNAAREEWPPGKLEAALHATDYWKRTTESQRRWDMVRITDPATAQRQFMLTAQHVQQMRQRLGVDISEETFTQIASDATRGTWSDDTLRIALVGAWQAGGYRTVAGGDLGATISDVRKLASEYGVTLSDGTVFENARRLAEGSMDELGMQDYVRQQAVSRYNRNEALVQALGRGVTTKQFADPYLQVAAKELNMNPENMSLMDSKWSRFLEDGPTPGQQGMTLDQWRRVVRSDQAYGWDKTQNAKDEAAALTTQLARKFGAFA